MAIKVEITTPFGKVYEDTADMVIVPAELGELGILPGHTPYLANLSMGVMRIKKDSNTEYFAANKGFVEINPDRVEVLCETCENAKKIDINRAIEARDRAVFRLKERKKGVDLQRAEIALKKALLRLKTANVSKIYQ
ncbi:MAG: F0F1 ATP synthase subunit epsilon [Candidatus Hydrogenedentota bacterium]